MASVTVATQGAGQSVAWLNSWDAFLWVGVPFLHSSADDSFDTLVRIGKQSRQVDLTINVDDDHPTLSNVKVMDFCTDLDGYLYVLVRADGPAVDVMKYYSTGKLIWSAHAQGVTTLSALSNRIVVDKDGIIGVFTSADEGDAGNGYPIRLQVLTQA